MKRRIEKLRALSLYEWRVMLIAMVLLPCVALILRIVGFQRTRKLLSCLIPDESALEQSDEAKIKKASVIARMVSISARYGPYRANCLKQALVIWWLLARQDISSEIRFGVNKISGKSLSAHAWVECGGGSFSNFQEYNQHFSVIG